MVQKLNRLIGRTDFRTLVFLSVLAVLVTIGWTYAQLSDDSNSVNSYEELVTDYLVYRENSYMLAVPSWYLLADQVETIESTYGLAGFQNQPDWYFNFNVGDRYFTTNSPLAGLVSHGTKLIIYEDMVSGEILVVRDTGTNFVEEIVFKSPEWPDIGKDDTSAYLLQELSKRRVVWHVTLKDVELAEEEFAAMLAAQDEEFEGGGMMMLMSGGSCSEIVFTGIEKQETNDVIDVGLCIPDGITNVDVFASTNLMTDGYPWVMVATNLSVVTNSVVWSWTNVVETNVFMAAADGLLDSDGDGLTDGREFYLFGTDMNLWDTDGDSYSDGEELQWGTDPLDIQSMPQLGRGVVINEFLYNPSGTDTGKEWVELFNTNRVNVDLSGFRIQVASNSFANVFLFPSNTILNSGDFLLVGGSSVTNADHFVELNMPNRFSFGPTAGIRLITPDIMSNLVVDACLYAPTNSFGLPTTGFGTDGFAPWAAESFSVKRIMIGYDSDQASDWTFTSSPTPTATGELLDIDGDGISNATEIAGYSTTYGFINTDYNNADTDFDGFSDSEETTNSPPTHPLEFDTDGDAFPWTTNGIYYGNDGDEVHNHGTDPTNPDSDGDGLPDGWEIAMGYNPTNTANGTADADADYDGDGVSNIDEMNQNSNPTDSSDFVPQDFRMVLFHLPKAGWQPGQDMGTKTWAGYRFDNVTKTTGVAFVIADGGHTAEMFSVSWEEAINDDDTGGRTNVAWAMLLPGTTPKLIITDGGTTWPNQNPAERGADLSIDRLTVESIEVDPSDGDSFDLSISGDIYNIATVKGSGNVTLKTIISPDIPETRSVIDWQAATEDGGDPLKSTVSRNDSDKHDVYVTVDGLPISQANVWVLWGTVEILTSGTTPPNAVQFGSLYDGTEILGGRLGPSGSVGGGKVVPVAQLSPDGVHAVVSNGWTFKREKIGRIFIDGTTNLYETTWNPDDSLQEFQNLIPDSDDKIYDRDAPDIGSFGATNCTEKYGIFRQWIEWNDIPASEQFSDGCKWYYTAKWYVSGSPQVIVNDVGGGNPSLPSSTQGCP